MNIKVCDRCKKELNDKNRRTIYFEMYEYECCKDCYPIFKQIKNNYEKKMYNLDQERIRIWNNIKEEINLIINREE